MPTLRLPRPSAPAAGAVRAARRSSRATPRRWACPSTRPSPRSASGLASAPPPAVDAAGGPPGLVRRGRRGRGRAWARDRAAPVPARGCRRSSRSPSRWPACWSGSCWWSGPARPSARPRSRSTPRVAPATPSRPPWRFAGAMPSTGRPGGRARRRDHRGGRQLRRPGGGVALRAPPATRCRLAGCGRSTRAVPAAPGATSRRGRRSWRAALAAVALVLSPTPGPGDRPEPAGPRGGRAAGGAHRRDRQGSRGQGRRRQRPAHRPRRAAPRARRAQLRDNPGDLDANLARLGTRRGRGPGAAGSRQRAEGSLDRRALPFAVARRDRRPEGQSGRRSRRGEARTWASWATRSTT